MKNPCKACPFKKDSAPGWLGGVWTAQGLHIYIMQENPFACHKTIPENQEDDHELEHCVGSILYMNKNAKRCSHNEKLADLQLAFKDYENIDDILGLKEFFERHKNAEIMKF